MYGLMFLIRNSGNSSQLNTLLLLATVPSILHAFTFTPVPKFATYASLIHIFS